ncbi:MAG: hypothetical protein QOJ12_542, partial [Thermoleophilales bacterium]|nr:hypothetical protein [Thermoleophilales bacterium]
VGLAVIPVALLWLAIGSGGARRSRVVTTALAAAGAVAVLGAYSIAEYSATGAVGMSRNGASHLYGRVAPFADCSRFTPPRGTEMLCEATARSERPITDAYIFSYWYSPAVRTFDNPFAATPQASAQVGAFARAVIVHQPLDYLEEVGAGMLRYVAPENDWLHGFGGGPGYDALVGRNILFNPVFMDDALASLGRYYGVTDYEQRPQLLAVLKGWERVTRIEGALFVVLALMSLAAPFATRGRERSVASLLALVAWTLLIAPVATLEFSARTAVPGFGFLAAAAAVGAPGLANSRRLGRLRSAVRGPEKQKSRPTRDGSPDPAFRW